MDAILGNSALRGASTPTSGTLDLGFDPWASGVGSVAGDYAGTGALADAGAGGVAAAAAAGAPVAADVAAAAPAAADTAASTLPDWLMSVLPFLAAA